MNGLTFFPNPSKRGNSHHLMPCQPWRSYHGQTKFHKPQVKVWFAVHDRPCHVWRGLEKNRVDWTRKAGIRRVELLSAGKTHEALFWPTAGLKVGTFDKSGISVEGTLISAPAVFLNTCKLPTETGTARCYNSRTAWLSQYYWSDCLLKSSPSDDCRAWPECTFWYACKRVFHSMLLQWRLKDPSHSTESAGGRLHLNMHTPFDPMKSEWADYAVQA